LTGSSAPSGTYSSTGVAHPTATCTPDRSRDRKTTPLVLMLYSGGRGFGAWVCLCERAQQLSERDDRRARRDAAHARGVVPWPGRSRVHLRMHAEHAPERRVRVREVQLRTKPPRRASARRGASAGPRGRNAPRVLRRFHFPRLQAGNKIEPRSTWFYFGGGGRGTCSPARSSIWTR